MQFLLHRPAGLLLVSWQGSEMNDSAPSEVPREGFLSNAVSCQVSRTLPGWNDEAFGSKALGFRDETRGKGCRQYH